MNDKLCDKLNQKSKQNKFPDNTLYRGISVKSVARLAKEFGVKGKKVEINALKNNIIPERYSRNMQTLSIQDQLLLLNSTVCIVGLGGLGGVVASNLARLGIGSLILVDGDHFEESNLNRQVFCNEPLIGQAKAKVAETKIKIINSSIKIHTSPVFLDEKNAGKIIHQADIVVDCLDNIETRFILETAAKQKKLPFISAAIGGENGHITTIFPQDKGLELIYGPHHLLNEKKGAETMLGCLPHAVTLIACLECAEVKKILLKKQPLLRNKIMLVDLANNLFDLLDLA